MLQFEELQAKLDAHGLRLEWSMSSDITHKCKVRDPQPARDAMSDKEMLTTREVYQILRDASMSGRAKRRVTTTSWDAIYCGLMTVDVDGWVITLFNDCGSLDYCDSCYSPDGRKYDFSSRDAFDPAELLAPEEHRQIEELLRRI